jgi:hypothetical protein
VHELLRLIRQWTWLSWPPFPAATGLDPDMGGLDAFLSEDESLDQPAADRSPSLAGLIMVVAVCAVVGVLAAFLSRPLWSTAAEAAAVDAADAGAPGADGAVDDRSASPAPAASAPPAGELLIDTDPPGARVSVDREWIGVSPITVANLAAGSHEIVVESARGRVTRNVQIKGGSEGSLVIALPPANRFASGWVTVTSAVPAQIFENGTLVGSTALPRVLLPAGRHDLEFVNAELGFHASRTVQVGAGQTLALDLETPSGSVSINARPWAEVFVDGRRVGETPIANLSLPIGERELVFRHPQFGERRQTIVVGLGAPTRIGVELDR